MSKRIIFFSGGVESTYLLTHANYNDIIVIAETAIFPGWAYSHSFHPTNTEKIVKAFGYEPVYFSCGINLPAAKFLQQTNIFLAAANFIRINDPSVSEVWTGLHPGDRLSRERATAIEAWNILHPGVPWIGPFHHMSKLEQWEGIPNDIKPLVSTCIYNKKCGLCKKCQEFQHLILDEKKRQFSI